MFFISKNTGPNKSAYHCLLVIKKHSMECITKHQSIKPGYGLRFAVDFGPRVSIEYFLQFLSTTWRRVWLRIQIASSDYIRLYSRRISLNFENNIKHNYRLYSKLIQVTRLTFKMLKLNNFFQFRIMMSFS